MTAETDIATPTPEPGRDDRPTTADVARRAPVETDPRGAAGEPRSFKENETPSGTATLADDDAQRATLLASDEAAELRERWDAIQAGFVDEPRKAVEDADSLVAQAMTRLAEMFADERAKLEGQWDRGSDVSTEDLRVALRRYRAFFGRLLAV